MNGQPWAPEVWHGPVWNRNVHKAFGNCCESCTWRQKGTEGRHFLHREMSVGESQGLVKSWKRQV